MKYEEGKTYTLTGDEAYYRGGTLRDYYAGTSLDFPVEAVFVRADSTGDLTFVTENGWPIYAGNIETETEAEADFDVVNKPEHYNTNLPEGVEVIDIIAAQTATLGGMQAVAQANVIKYVLRWQKKNGVQDLEKARFYLNRLIGGLS